MRREIPTEGYAEAYCIITDAVVTIDLDAMRQALANQLMLMASDVLTNDTKPLFKNTVTEDNLPTFRAAVNGESHDDWLVYQLNIMLNGYIESLVLGRDAPIGDDRDRTVLIRVPFHGLSPYEPLQVSITTNWEFHDPNLNGLVDQFEVEDDVETATP